jgi:alkylation response protein AidB-like acyl-CoA dehydrogenase
MSTDLSALSADELGARTRTWLSEHLPAGWMEAIDAGDAATVSALRGRLDYATWCTQFGESGFATPTWPAEYGAGLSLAPGSARAVN